MTKPTPLLIVDIDGTIRQGKDDPLGKFVNGPEDVRVFPGAVHALKAWRAGGGRILTASNQAGVEHGYVTEEQVWEAMLETHDQAGKTLEFITYCTHAECFNRKPNPGMLHAGLARLQARYPTEVYKPSHTMMVGDRPEDAEMAYRAGIHFVNAAQWRNATASYAICACGNRIDQGDHR